MTPEKRALALAAAINDGALDAAVSCFAANGCLVTPDSTTVVGHERIRPVLAQLVARGVKIDVEASSVQVVGAVAIVQQRWTIRSPGPTGIGDHRRTRPALTLRDDAAGWKLIHALPWREGS